LAGNRFSSEAGLTSRQAQRIFLGVLILAFLALVLLLDGGEEGTVAAGIPPTPEGREISGVPEKPLAPIRDAEARVGREELVPFRAVDRLTGEALPLSALQLVEAGRNHEWQGPEFQVPRNLLEKSGAIWRYPIPIVQGTRDFEIPVDQARPEHGRLALPYKSGVRGRVTKAYESSPVEGATVKIFAFDRKKLDDLLVQQALPLQYPPPVYFFLGGERAYRSRYGSLSTWKTPSFSNGSFRQILPVSGSLVLMVSFPDRVTRITTLELVPGSWTEWNPILESRPAIEGRVFNEAGEGVPKCNVSIYSMVDPSTGDFAGLQMGSTGINLGDGNPTYIAENGLLTDEGGRFSAPMPGGTRYAVQAIRGSESDFREVSALETEKDVVHVDLYLGRSLTPPIPLQFEDGSPVVGASIQWVIGNDFPWVRQFPLVQEADDGTIRMPDVAPGKKLWMKIDGGNLGRPFSYYTSGGMTKIVIPLEFKTKKDLSSNRQHNPEKQETKEKKDER